jgi:hypothetical protein
VRGMDFKWEQQTGKYQRGEWLRVGKVVVGSAGYYHGSRDDPNKYGCNCLLPDIKQATERYATLEEAKARLERQVRAWFSWVQP